MQTELAMIKSNLHPFPSGSSTSGSVGFSAAASMDDDTVMNSRGTTPLGSGSLVMDQLAVASEGGPMTMIEPQQPVTWKISLSPSGLRIDTNIASVTDLYHILLHGISQLNINSESATNLFSTDSLRTDGSKQRQHKAWGRYAQQRTKALEQTDMQDDSMGLSAGQQSSGRLWEVDDNEARKIIQERKSADDTVPQNTLDHLMQTCYHKCFLAYQIVDKDSFTQQYSSEASLDPLLVNSINAWVSKHGCIYHNTCPDKDPATVGEAYFKNARQLLKKCFDISSPTTVHALLNLYMYQLSCERSSLAYLYIGLAIRMAQDLKFHKKEHMPADLKQREASKRLWWSAYWLDLCAALESNRPTMVDDKDCDLEYPTKLDSEDEETGYRISFCVHSIKLMKIRKDITKHLPSEQSGQSLLSAISRLENALTNWLNELPQDLHFEPETTFVKTNSFRDEARLILNIQFQTTWIMLHKFFLPKQNQTATPVALLSLNICTKSANFISKMLDIYAQNLCWCQFFYALDGVIASVSIHQSNALSNEKDVACLAQRNLIMTANVLRGSPLLYMDKVNTIIESIEVFLKENNLPTDLSKLPSVNEDLVNQQSIFSVFHPGVFDQQNQQQQQQQQAQQQQPQQSNAGVPSPSQKLGRMSTPSQSSPKSQTPATSASVMAQDRLSPHPRAPSQQQQQQQQRLTSPIPMATSPQPPISEQTNQQPPSQQLAASLGYSDLPGATSGNMMPNAGMLFNDPSLMAFGGAAGTGVMDQLLFRDMNFGMDQGVGSQQEVFGSLGSLDAASFASSAPTNTTFPFADLGQGSLYAQQHTPPQQQQQQQPQQHPHPHQQQHQAQQQQQQQQSSRPNTNNGSFAQNLFGNPTMFGLQGDAGASQGFPMNDPTTSSGGDTFDPAALFGNVNMDPAAMNALLYGPGAGAPGTVPMSFGQHTIPQASTNQADYAAAMYAAASRKRAHREWDDSA